MTPTVEPIASWRNGRWLRLRDPWSIAPVIFAVLLGAVMYAVMHRGLIEDSFITLDYARNLAQHFQWALLPGHPSNTATSPLNVMLLGALTAVTGDVLRALAVLTVVNCALMALGLLALGRLWGLGRSLAWVALPLLLSAPLLDSTVGMETLLSVTLMLWLLRCAYAGDFRGYGWLSGVAAVLRADLAVVVIVIWLLHPQVRRPLVRSTVGTVWRGLVVLAPWYLFSWVYFGSAIPDTLAIKQHARWGDFLLAPFTKFPHMFPLATLASLIMAGAGLAAGLLVLLVFRRAGLTPIWSPLVPVVTGAAYFLAYVALGVPQYTWYYGVPLAGGLLTLAAVISQLAHLGARDRTRRSWHGIAVGVVLTLAALTPNAGYWATRTKLPLNSAPMFLNWATPAQYRVIGDYLGRRFGNRKVAVLSAGEFGEMLFYCHCTLVDQFDSRAVLAPVLAQQRQTSLPMRVNYLWYDAAKYPPIPTQWQLRFTRAEPFVHPRWHVRTASHRAGWYSLVRRNHA